MATPFIGEIRLFAGNFAPANWSFCDGSTIAISQNAVLFDLIGTTYGGNGQTTFVLPDLRGRVPVHQGGGLILGQSGGTETVTLTGQQMPAHTHTAAGASAGNSGTPLKNFWSTDPGGNTAAYSTAAADSSLGPEAIATAGSGLPHDNMSPFLAITYIISLFGVFPSQN